jgi:integrase
MSVKVRPYRNGGWEVDIRVAMPDGAKRRERRKAPVSAKSGALRWGRARERALLIQPPTGPRKEVVTLEDFAPRFLDGYARANRQKPSEVASKETILRYHLIPLLGTRKLDAISNEDVQRLKSNLDTRAPKTVNNVLTVLNTLLKVAVEWGVVDRMPCTIRLVRTQQSEAQFHDFHEYTRLIEGAEGVDPESHLIVLLGGDAGLRCGEMMALEWTDVDLDRRQLHIRRSEWKGNVTAPKGGRKRVIPLTSRLAGALRSYRHLMGPRVLCRVDGKPLTQKMVQNQVRRAARLANLANGGVHILRHTFCSHLAMRGAPARAIQELAGHKDLSTTQRYMHLSPAAIEESIRLLEKPSPVPGFGDILETGDGEIQKLHN